MLLLPVLLQLNAVCLLEGRTTIAQAEASCQNFKVYPPSAKTEWPLSNLAVQTSFGVPVNP